MCIRDRAASTIAEAIVDAAIVAACDQTGGERVVLAYAVRREMLGERIANRRGIAQSEALDAGLTDAALGQVRACPRTLRAAQRRPVERRRALVGGVLPG